MAAGRVAFGHRMSHADSHAKRSAFARQCSRYSVGMPFPWLTSASSSSNPSSSGMLRGADILSHHECPRQAFALQQINVNRFMHWSIWQKRAYAVISTPQFDACVGLIIVINAIVIGLEVDNTNGVPKAFYDGSEIFFFTVFCSELVLRVYVFRCGFFASFVNLGDCLIIFAGLVGIILESSSSQWVVQNAQGSLKNFSVVRVIRLLRLVRILRLSTQFRSLWMIVQGLTACISTVLWTAVLLAVVCYFFGVIAVDFVASDEKLQKVVFDTSQRTVAERFSNLPRALISLFEFYSLTALSGKGFDIIMAQPWAFLYLLAFALIVPIVLLNLVTAVLVDMAINASISDQEHARVLALTEWEAKCEDLEELFFKMTYPDGASAISPERSGGRDGFMEYLPRKMLRKLFRRRDSRTAKSNDVKRYSMMQTLPNLNRDDVERLCDDEEVREHLNLLFGEARGSHRGVDILKELWMVLDIDDDGDLNLEEFTEGLGRLHGVIHSHSADAFIMMRLVKLHYEAREERRAQTEEVQQVRELHVQHHREREEMQRELMDRMESLDQKLESLDARLGEPSTAGAKKRHVVSLDSSIVDARKLPSPPPPSIPKGMTLQQGAIKKVKVRVSL